MATLGGGDSRQRGHRADSGVGRRAASIGDSSGGIDSSRSQQLRRAGRRATGSCDGPARATVLGMEFKTFLYAFLCPMNEVNCQWAG